MLTRKMISIVPIAYGDEGNIAELYKRVTKVMTKIAPNYEIIYVCDASPDKSEEILKKLARKDKKLTVMLHARNFGAQNAFTTGMKQAVGDAVIIMDGDLQDPPELFEEFIRKWLEGYQVVYGVRRQREKSMGAFLEYLYHMFYVVWDRLSYLRIPPDVGDFSLMDRKVVDIINQLPERDRFIRGLRAWVGFKQIGVNYIRPERFSGKPVSTNTIFKSLQWVRKAVSSFSYAPLDWVFNLAVLSVFLSVFAIFFYLIMFFINPGAPRGFMTILLAVLFLGSVQLVVLSIMSEYIRRMFEEVKGRPISIVKEVINDHKTAKRSRKL